MAAIWNNFGPSNVGGNVPPQENGFCPPPPPSPCQQQLTPQQQSEAYGMQGPNGDAMVDIGGGGQYSFRDQSQNNNEFGGGGAYQAGFQQGVAQGEGYEQGFQQGENAAAQMEAGQGVNGLGGANPLGGVTSMGGSIGGYGGINPMMENSQMAGYGNAGYGGYGGVNPLEENPEIAAMSGAGYGGYGAGSAGYAGYNPEIGAVNGAGYPSTYGSSGASASAFYEQEASASIDAMEGLAPGTNPVAQSMEQDLGISAAQANAFAAPSYGTSGVESESNLFAMAQQVTDSEEGLPSGTDPVANSMSTELGIGGSLSSSIPTAAVLGGLTTAAVGAGAMFTSANALNSSYPMESIPNNNVGGPSFGGEQPQGGFGVQPFQGSENYFNSRGQRGFFG